MDRIKLAVVVSDLHCGSDVGLLPLGAVTEKGNAIGQNLCQQWLWSKWEEMLESVGSIVGDDPFALLINGDATEGIHHHSTEIVSAKISEHLQFAEQALAPLAQRAAHVFVSKGTECHTLNMESQLAARLCAEGLAARDKWQISINSCLIDMAHHMPATSRRYLEAGALSITLGNARLNYADAGHRLPKVFLRGHRHCGGYYSNGHAAIGVTGGWQFLTRHGHKVVTDAIPHPSSLILDWRTVPEGGLPIPHILKYDPPPHECTIL